MCGNTVSPPSTDCECDEVGRASLGKFFSGRGLSLGEALRHIAVASQVAVAAWGTLRGWGARDREREHRLVLALG